MKRQQLGGQNGSLRCARCNLGRYPHHLYCPECESLPPVEEPLAFVPRHPTVQASPLTEIAAGLVRTFPYPYAARAEQLSMSQYNDLCTYLLGYTGPNNFLKSVGRYLARKQFITMPQATAVLQAILLSHGSAAQVAAAKPFRLRREWVGRSY
jgi:hypothetical protein